MRMLLAALAAWVGSSLFVPSALSAQAGVKRLTVAEAVRLALLHNPDSRSAEQDVASARGAVTQAELLPNPALFISALDTNISPADAPLPNQFGLTWTLPIGGKRAATIASARSEVGAAQASQAAARRELALQVESAFVQLLLDQALLEFAKQDQQTFEQSVQINEVRYADGKIAYGEVLKLRIQAREVDDTVRQAVQSVSDDRAELTRLLGASTLAADFQAVGSLDAPDMPGNLAARDVLARALAHRPDYRALLAQRDSARHALDLARRQPIPDLGILADYNRIPGTAGSYDLQLTAELPLLDRNQGTVAQARAAYTKSQLAIDALEDQMRASATTAVQAWRTAQERLTAYGEDFVKTAKESLDISRHSYEQGRGALLEYLDAESSYRDVQRAYRTAQAQAILAAANIRFVAGDPLP